MLTSVDWPLIAVGVGWAMFWIFAIYSSLFQLLSIVTRSPLPPERDCHETVTVLYVTCDDFNVKACESCFAASDGNRFVICDDSSCNEIKLRIDDWALQRSVQVTRRANRVGFKAGNVNYAINNVVRDDFILICDADERLPVNCIPRFLDYFAEKDVAFVQASHTAIVDGCSWYARAMSPAVSLLFEFCLPSHDRFGFVSCYGHGVMVRHSTWKEVGGFPELTSEDLAFALECRLRGYRGRFAANIRAQEEHPSTFAAFSKKYRKIVRGTIEVLQRYSTRVMKCKYFAWYERIDFLATFAFCYIPLLICINALASILYFHERHIDEMSVFGQILSTVGPLTPFIPTVVMLRRAPRLWLQFLLVGGISYTSILPTLSVDALRGIFHISNRVWVPSGSLTGPKYGEHLLPILAGLVFVSAAIGLQSAASSPILVLGGIMIVSPVVSIGANKGRN